MMSAPAARTFCTSSPRRAKSAERMEGAITYFFGSHDILVLFVGLVSELIKVS